MRLFRIFFATLVSVVLLLTANPELTYAGPPLGILTLALSARVDTAIAFAGLSVFEGEMLSTEHDGRLGARLGDVSMALSGNSGCTVHKLDGGAHIDLERGSVFVSAPPPTRYEVHLEGAMLRSEAGASTNTQITLLGPKSIQVAARRGDVDFLYKDEFQVLREGSVYRIDLDTPGTSPSVISGGGGAGAPGSLHRATYFILAGAGTGALIWGVRELSNAPAPAVSPAKP
jgi:hypothetical protein